MILQIEVYCNSNGTQAPAPAIPQRNLSFVIPPSTENTQLPAGAACYLNLNQVSPEILAAFPSGDRFRLTIEPLPV